MSGEYGGWGNISQLSLSRYVFTTFAIWGRGLSCWRIIRLCLSALSGRIFFTAHRKKFGTDAAPSGRAVAFTGGELCDYAFGYAAFLCGWTDAPFLGSSWLKSKEHISKQSNYPLKSIVKFQFIWLEEAFPPVGQQQQVCRNFGRAVSPHLHSTVHKKVNLLTYEERCSWSPV